MKRLASIAGQKFGRLTVVEFSHFVGVKPGRKPHWKCLCDCGRETIVYTGHLKSGHTQSCGCFYIKDTLGHLQNSVYLSYRAGAKVRGFSFSLSREELVSISQQDCSYCGQAPSNNKAYTYSTGAVCSFRYNGVDRVDNTGGYSLDNCVPCCFQCNRAKMNQTAEEFIAHCKLVASRN
jgi:hypothetical protein